MKKIFAVILVCCFSISGYTQEGNNLLKKHEVALLNILISDTTNNTSFVISSNSFNFGINEKIFTYTNIVKNKKEVFIQPLGTGMLYQAKKVNNTIRVDRIDKTIHSGVSFFAQNFFLNDTLYQYGGLGFWQIRGIITAFSPTTKQWEMVQADRSVPSFFDAARDAVMHYENYNNRPKLFVSNSYYYKDYPRLFEVIETDSVYSYDFIDRHWTTLGKINPIVKKLLDNKHSREIELHLNNFLISQSQLDFFWMDFRNNKFGNLDPKFNTLLRETWLTLYNEEKRTKDQVVFQFNLGNDLYFIKYDEKYQLEWKKIKIDESFLDQKNVSNIYINDISFTDIITTNYQKHVKAIRYSILLFILIIIFVIVFFTLNKKKKLPKEVITILNNNFFSSLSVIEKELIEILYQHYLKNEELPTRIINKVIGVQQKDTLTQNKSRSDYFIRINQKYKLATRHTDPLIIKNRDQADKRQYNYSLNQKFIGEIEKILKD